MTPFAVCTGASLTISMRVLVICKMYRVSCNIHAHSSRNDARLLKTLSRMLYDCLCITKAVGGDDL